RRNARWRRWLPRRRGRARRRASLRHAPQARHCASRTARRRPRLLSLRLQRRPHRLCRGDGAGGASDHAAGGDPRRGRVPARFLRSAGIALRDLQAVDRDRRAFAEHKAGRALRVRTRTRTATMTMKIGVILTAAVLIAAAVPARAQETYPTPEAAVKDLIDSAKAKTPGFGDRILGKEGAALLRSGDADEDAQNLKAFNEAAPASTAIDDGPDW